jgi:hypothetical protein
MKACLCVALLSISTITFAQSGPPCGAAVATMSGSRFSECARVAAEKYQDRTKAIADGYRPIGRDFPAMGEHWIRVSLLFDGSVDPRRPEVLNYVLVNGQPKLVGLGFATPLLAGEPAPESPAGRAAWHDHTRTIEDETVHPHVDGGHANHDGDPGPRVAMLHTWLWAPNPDGVFAVDNWSLAFVRLGLTVPANFPQDAAKALSLLTGGDAFFEELFMAESRPIPRDRALVKSTLLQARRKVENAAGRGRSTDLNTDDLSTLDAIWKDTLRAIDERR